MHQIKAHFQIGFVMWAVFTTLNIETSYSQDAQALFAKAKELFDNGELKTAESLFRRGIEIDNSNPLAYFYLGMVIKNEGNSPTKYRPYFEKAYQLDPSGTVGADAMTEMLRADSAITQNSSNRSNLQSISGKCTGFLGRDAEHKRWYSSSCVCIRSAEFDETAHNGRLGIFQKIDVYYGDELHGSATSTFNSIASLRESGEFNQEFLFDLGPGENGKLGKGSWSKDNDPKSLFVWARATTLNVMQSGSMYLYRNRRQLGPAPLLEECQTTPPN